MKYIRYLCYFVWRAKGVLVSPLCLLLLLAATAPGAIMQTAGALAVLNAQNQFPHVDPFMSLPYYGTEDFHKRITSYFDHDKPWYVSDNLFIRYDGKRWKGSQVTVLNCDAGVNCYDGHNGYDLNLWFEPVLSVAAGKVIHAGWYNPLNHNASFGLWVAIDHGNGLATVYGHLSTLTVALNEHVGAQWQVGTSGTTGSSTGPHLHFGTYYYPAWRATDPLGWTGKNADPNIVPDYNLWTSGTNNTPVPLLSSKGKQVFPGALLIDDGDPGWSSTGTWHIAKSASDIGGELRWTATTSHAATATATWKPQLPADGYYEVGVYVDDKHASSGWATYTIYSADPAHPGTEVKHQVEVDESHIGVFQSSFGQVITHAQWISLGTYYFTRSQRGRVVLSNATGEDGLQIAADGVEFAPLVPPTRTNQPAPAPTGTPTHTPTVTSTPTVTPTLTPTAYSGAPPNPISFPSGSRYVILRTPLG